MRTGLDLGTMAAYATLPNLLALDEEVGWGLHIIASGAKFWPGNHEPITTEEKENYQAAWVVEALEGIILQREEARNQHNQLPYNPFIDEAVATIDDLFPGGVTPLDLKLGRAIVNKWTELAYSDPRLSEIETLDKTGAFVVKQAPHLAKAVEAKKARVRKVYLARGTVQEESIDLGGIEEKIRALDISQVPPEYIEVIDGELVEPATRNLDDVFRAAGVEIGIHDFPYYATFGTRNGKEVLKSMFEDLILLQKET